MAELRGGHSHSLVQHRNETKRYQLWLAWSSQANKNSALPTSTLPRMRGMTYMLIYILEQWDCRQFSKIQSDASRVGAWMANRLWRPSGNLGRPGACEWSRRWGHCSQRFLWIIVTTTTPVMENVCQTVPALLNLMIISLTKLTTITRCAAELSCRSSYS